MRSLSTGYISPQYHLVFGDLFETFIIQGDDDSIIASIYNDLLISNMDWYTEESFDGTGKIIYRTPPLHNVWIYERGRRVRNAELARQKIHNEDHTHERNHEIPMIDIIPLNTNNYYYSITQVALISDNEMSVNYSVGQSPSESEVDFFYDSVAPPSDDPNISPEVSPDPRTRPNNSPEGYASLNQHPW